MKKNQNGFSIIEILIVLVVIGLVGFATWMFVTHKPGSKTDQKSSSSNSGSAGTSGSTVNWSFNGTDWKASGTPPACPSPLMSPPVDFESATAVLYPGQTRGGNYKTHGGFIFANGTNAKVTVKVPMDAKLYKGCRYIEQGETQYLLFFVNPCGIMYRFDHLATLSSAFQKIVDDNFPAAQENNSGTTNFAKDYQFKVGDVVATAVGFIKTGSTTVDFGVYDLRQPNAISKDATWAAAHADFREFAVVGTCWFDDFGTDHAAHLRSLPAGDQASGATSDYCKS